MTGETDTPSRSTPGQQVAPAIPTQTMAVTPGDAAGVNLDTSVHCIELCKHSGRAKRGNKQLDTIQCTMCARWFHNDCVGFKKDEIIGIWPCTTCRLMPRQIQNIHEMVTALTHAIDAISTTNTQIVKQLREKDTQIAALTEDNRHLTKEIASLNTQMSKKAWEAFTSKQALLIGDSLLKSIDEKKLQKTKVKSLPGAKISDITNYLTNDADHYRQVVICVGTNDCDGEMNVDLLAQQYEELIQVTTENVLSTDSIIISSVPPRTDNVDKQRRVEELNSILNNIATKAGVQYVTHDPSFRLADCSQMMATYLPTAYT